MELTYDNFVDQLVCEVPELKPIYDKHIRQNHEVLQHVFFGDLTRFVEQEYKRSIPLEENDVIKRIVQFLEIGMSVGVDLIEELIVASFFENLCPNREVYVGLRAIMGPRLKSWSIKYERLSGWSKE